MGKTLRKAGVSIEGGRIWTINNINTNVLYSDHDNQLIIVPDNYNKAKKISDDWMKVFWS